MNIIERAILKIIGHRVSNWFALERSLSLLENALTACPDSPEKSWPNPHMIPGGEEVPFSLKNLPIVGPSLSSCISQGVKAIKSVSKNPPPGKHTISHEQLADLEAYALSHGIGAIGYTQLAPHLIFKDRAVLFDKAIVLLSEMDKSAIQKAPSVKTFKMVMSTYDTLGKTTNLLTDRLRSMGFQAQASHPLGGLVLYPALAVAAGLGWFGRHGLLITPQFGARQRISSIFVNIDNLPISTGNNHGWIGEFCQSCGKCIKSCPSKAILEQPIQHHSGRKTHIVRENCLPVFVKYQGCTICIKECTFTKLTYSEVYQRYLQASTPRTMD